MFISIILCQLRQTAIFFYLIAFVSYPVNSKLKLIVKIMFNTSNLLRLNRIDLDNADACTILDSITFSTVLLPI